VIFIESSHPDRGKVVEHSIGDDPRCAAQLGSRSENILADGRVL
jgi:hypothetical protein